MYRGGEQPLKYKEKKLKLTTLGFTLIELLAVIVILAIIAIIATPTILNVIKDSKNQTKKIGALNYLDAVEQAIVRKNMKDIFKPTQCNIEIGGIICEGEKLNIEIDGEVPTKGKLYLDKGKIASNSFLGYDEYSVKVNKNGQVEIRQSKIYNDGDIIYFDILKGKGCTESEYESSMDETIGAYLNSVVGYNGYLNKDSSNNEIAKLEKQNSCLKFYSFLDDGGEKINLILDHNTTSKIAWSNSDVTASEQGPIDVINQLRMDTDNWNGTVTPSNYEYKSDIAKSYIIDYSNYKARLITAQEIAQIAEYKNWNEGINTYDFSYNCWLSLISKDSYWTASIYPYKQTLYAWVVFSTSLSGGWTTMGYIKGASNGVRPVIEVLKSNL